MSKSPKDEKKDKKKKKGEDDASGSAARSYAPASPTILARAIRSAAPRAGAASPGS